MGFGKDGKGVIITHADIVTLATLANNTAIKQASPLALQEDFRLIKLTMAAALVGLTPGEVPIHFYLCNGELTVAEIAENITNAGPLDRNDRVQQERAERAVFLIGTFPEGVVADIPVHGDGGEEGIINKTIRWTFSNPEGWAIVAFNQAGVTLTTGAVIRFVSKYYGVWVT